MSKEKKFDPWFRNHLIRDSIYKAIYEQMKADSNSIYGICGKPSIYIMGEGSQMKIHFDATYIEKEFPYQVITLPISEDANTNFAVGMALGGAIPIVDVITADFLYRTMDSICNTARVTNFVQDPKTIIVRAEFLTAGPTTGQRPEALFTHIPGLNVVIPSNPVDAYDLTKAALHEKAVTLFFEDRMIPDATTPELDDSRLFCHVPEKTLGKARLYPGVRKPKLTVVSYGLTFRTLYWLTERFADVDLIDLRSIYPIDFETVFESVKKTGACLIVEPDVQYAGVGAEISAQVSEQCFKFLRTPVRRLGAPRMTIPSARCLHDLMLPSKKIILYTIEGMIHT